MIRQPSQRMWTEPCFTSIQRIEKASLAVLVSMIPLREDPQGEVRMGEVERLSQRRLPLASILLMLIVQKPVRIEHRPRLTTIPTPRQQTVLTSRNVVSPLDDKVPLREPHQNLIPPLPHAVVRRPPMKPAFLNGRDVVLDGPTLITTNHRLSNDYGNHKTASGDLTIQGTYSSG